jgi:hypothetical protein
LLFTQEDWPLSFFSPLFHLIILTSEQAPFTSEIVGSILTVDTCVRRISQRSRYRKSGVFSAYSGFLPQGMLQGRIFIFFKGGVEKLLVGCKRHYWAIFDRGWALRLKTFTQNRRGEAKFWWGWTLYKRG